MRDYEYKVTFKTGLFEIVRAGNKNEAKILAQAKQIKKANRYAVSKVEKIDERR